MESLSKQEIQFLIALNASEESRLFDLAQEFEQWGCQSSEVLNALRVLVEDGTLLFTRCTEFGFVDLSPDQCAQYTESWSSVQERDIALFFTPQGEARWREYDWGISSKRAEHLIFRAGGRVKPHA